MGTKFIKKFKVENFKFELSYHWKGVKSCTREDRLNKLYNVKFKGTEVNKIHLGNTPTCDYIEIAVNNNKLMVKTHYLNVPKKVNDTQAVSWFDLDERPEYNKYHLAEERYTISTFDMLTGRPITKLINLDLTGQQAHNIFHDFKENKLDLNNTLEA